MVREAMHADPGGTFCVHNYGDFGEGCSAPINNHAEMAILGAGRNSAKPRDVHCQLGRKVTELTQASITKFAGKLRRADSFASGCCVWRIRSFAGGHLT